MPEPRAIGPLTEEDPYFDAACPACDEPFKVGEFMTLVRLGPGDDPIERERARAGRPYSAVHAAVHYACAVRMSEKL